MTISLRPAAVRCDTVLHRAFARDMYDKSGVGGEVRHGVTSGVSCETSSTKTCNTSPPEGVHQIVHISLCTVAQQTASDGTEPCFPIGEVRNTLDASAADQEAGKSHFVCREHSQLH